ncbi:MAG TPA: nitrate/sulfonate/bicarbonate ABC transporter ATP-binding protein [Thermoleophilaceae bacterium]
MTLTQATPGRPDARAAIKLVEARRLVKTFPTKDGELSVLEGIDLEVREGEIVALLGRSGSGKSTLLRCIAGLIPPSDGFVLYREQPFVGTNPGAAMVFQSFALLPWLTVQQNVELGLEARGMPPAERAERALSAIDLIGLDGFESAYPKELSGGMRQRVGFARALVIEPDVLLMDEPFSALDVLTAENLRTELLELWATGEFPTKAILIVTHNIEEAVLFADRVIVLGTNPGHIKAEIPIGLERPRDRRTPEFEALLDRIYGIMTGREAEDEAVRAAPVEPADAAVDARPVMLPHASVDGLSGLLEILRDAGGTADLADLADDLSLEVDDLLPLVDACLLLGLVTTHDGELRLTDDGRRFADADIQESKQLFARVATERVPLVRTIRNALARADDGALKEAFFLDVLGRHYSAEEAEAQLNTAIDWGRYGELYEYDADTDELTRHLDHASPRPS